MPAEIEVRTAGEDTMEEVVDSNVTNDDLPIVIEVGPITVLLDLSLATHTLVKCIDGEDRVDLVM